MDKTNFPKSLACAAIVIILLLPYVVIDGHF